MGDIAYSTIVVKIIETPNCNLKNVRFPLTKFRVQFPQKRKKSIAFLEFWGNVANDVAKYYRINDYVIVEGYVVFSKESDKNLVNRKKNSSKRRIIIKVRKIYPFFLS